MPTYLHISIATYITVKMMKLNPPILLRVVICKYAHKTKTYYCILTDFIPTKVKRFSDCVITAILDHPNCFMACTIPTTISASLGTVLRKRGNIPVLDRWGDDDIGEI